MNSEEKIDMDIRIILADNHTIMLEGLNALIKKQSDITVIGMAECGHEAVKLVQELLPDVIIMSLSIPYLNGVEATYQITSNFKDTKVIILSMHEDKYYVIKALKAGALGYLHKSCSFDEVIRAVQTVVNNKFYLSSNIAAKVFRHYVHALRNGGSLIPSPLTDRECEVLQMITEGNSTNEIATNLSLSVKTIETHRKNIMDKLDIHSIAELTKYAIRESVTTIDK